MGWKQRITQFVRGDDRKVTFFINVKDELDRVADFLNGPLKDISARHLMVFFNLEIPRQFAKTNLRVDSSENYLSREDYESIDKYVFEGLSRSWYLYDGITEYRGIPLGRIFEYDFQKYLIPRIKNLEIIRRVDDKEDIQKIIAIDATAELGGIARLYGRAKGIPVLEISFNRDRNLSSALSSKVRIELSNFLRGLFDRLAFKKIMEDKDNRGLILIDAKLAGSIKLEMPFLQCPLEKGTRVRLGLIRRGFPYLPICFTKNRRYSRDWVAYRKRWRSLCHDGKFSDIFVYKDISIWEIVKGQISDFFSEGIPMIISNINMLNAVSERRDIKVAVLRNDVKKLERIIVFGLRLAGVSSVVLQHGVLAETNGHNILLADKYAAWGRTSVEWYERFGNSVEKFEVTGNPLFDALADWRPALSKQELCKQLNLDAAKGIILFATQQINKFSSFWTDDLFWVMADKLLAAMRQFPDKQLVIKTDPYEDMSHYRKRIMASSHNNAIAIKEADIYTLIFLSELVITLDSTVALEAMAFDKPVITFNLTKRKDRVPYAEKAAALGVYDGQDLAGAIERALNEEETIRRLRAGRERFIEEYAYKMDGRARERISNLLKRYIEN